MADTERRAALGARAQTLREAAEALRAQVVDPGMKDLIRRLVMYTLDDVQDFFLGNTKVRESFETTWLDHAELTLRGAEEQFRNLSEAIDKYGGPKNVQVIG